MNFLGKLIQRISAFGVKQNQTCVTTETKPTANPNRPHYAEEENVVYLFNMNDMQFINHYDEQNGYDLYKMPHTFLDKLAPCVNTLNRLLADAGAEYQELPKIMFRLCDLNFVDSNGGVYDFCTFKHHPKTKTGKTAKYPYSISITTKKIEFDVQSVDMIFANDGFDFADIYFDKNGNFTKGRVIYKEGLSTSNFRCYRYRIKLVDGILQISSIEVFKNNLTEKIK